MKLTDNVFCYPENGMMDCNTYVIKDDVGVIIDPGIVPCLPVLAQQMQQDGINPEDIGIITCTHLHLDHYWASEAFQEISGARILLHPLHKQFYDIGVVQISRIFGIEPVDIKEDGFLEEQLNTGKLELELIKAPGHSPESICFYSRDQRVMICGDVVFAGNTGRVDFPGGNADQLKQSIEGFSELNIEYLLPGHMDIVVGAERVKENFEFVRTRVFPWL